MMMMKTFSNDSHPLQTGKNSCNMAILCSHFSCYTYRLIYIYIYIMLYNIYIYIYISGILIVYIYILHHCEPKLVFVPPQLECRQVDGMEAEKAEAKKKHGYVPTSLYVYIYICLHNVYYAIYTYQQCVYMFTQCQACRL